MAATKITSDTIFEQLEDVRHLFYSREGGRGGGNTSELEPFSYDKYNLENEKRKLFSWMENLDCPCVKDEIYQGVREFKEEEEATTLPSRLSDGMYNFLEMIALKEYFLNPKNVFEFISGMTNESYSFCQCLEKNRSHEIEIDSASCLICHSCNTVTCLQCFESVNNEEEKETEEEKKEEKEEVEEEDEERKAKDSTEIKDFCTSSRRHHRESRHHRRRGCGRGSSSRCCADPRFLTFKDYLNYLERSFPSHDKNFYWLLFKALNAMILTNYQDTSVFRNLIIKDITDKLFEYQIQVCVKGGETDCLSFPMDTNYLVNDAWKGNKSVYKLKDNVEDFCYCEELLFLFTKRCISRLSRFHVIGNYALFVIDYSIRLSDKLVEVKKDLTKGFENLRKSKSIRPPTRGGAGGSRNVKTKSSADKDSYGPLNSTDVLNSLLRMTKRASPTKKSGAKEAKRPKIDSFKKKVEEINNKKNNDAGFEKCDGDGDDRGGGGGGEGEGEGEGGDTEGDDDKIFIHVNSSLEVDFYGYDTVVSDKILFFPDTRESTCRINDATAACDGSRGGENYFYFSIKNQYRLLIPPILINNSRNHVFVLKGINHKFNFCESRRRDNPRHHHHYLGYEISKHILNTITRMKFKNSKITEKLTEQNFAYLSDLLKGFNNMEVENADGGNKGNAKKRRWNENKQRRDDEKDEDREKEGISEEDGNEYESDDNGGGGDLLSVKHSDLIYSNLFNYK
nr:MAG: hypothetical protein [Porcellio scaber clopovirus]